MSNASWQTSLYRRAAALAIVSGLLEPTDALIRFIDDLQSILIPDEVIEAVRAAYTRTSS